MTTRIREGDASTKPTLFKRQADATLSQANPTSGTKYTVLDTTKNVRIISIEVNVTWTVQPTPLEIHITIDGQTITHGQIDPVSTTNYFCYRHPAHAASSQQMTSTLAVYQAPAWLYEARSIKIEAETTGGTTSNLSARVKYAKM